MSRLRKFTHSLLSSYVLMGVNVIYTLISVPLALAYLSKAEFGLWALTLQVAGYIALIDLGMASSISRSLIEHKDDRASGRYGGIIQSGFLVCLAQGLISLIVGMSLVWFMGTWLKVPPDLARPFLWLMIGQVWLTAMSFVSRMFNQLLYAWQRLDVINYSGMVQLGAGFVALWSGFILGFGIYSLLLGTVMGWIFGVGFSASACARLGFWPKPGEWGQPSRKQFRELFSYGAELFLIGIGTQLINSSQTILVSRQLGVEAAALWSVMTKLFNLFNQVVVKIVGNAWPAIMEMHVRQERERLWHRYHGLFSATTVFAGVSGVLLAACNGPFVSIWTRGRFGWPAWDNALLALWMIVSAQQFCHVSFISCLKQIRGLQFIFLLEGAMFIAVSFVILPSTGMTGMLSCSLAATTLFTWLCSLWRVAGLSGLGLKPFLWDWQRPLFRVLVILVPCWLVTAWLLGGASEWLRLVVNGVLLTMIGAWVSLRFALPSDLVAEVVGKLPPPLRRVATILSLQLWTRPRGE